MEGFDAHPGTVKLALALSRRMKNKIIDNLSPLRGEEPKDSYMWSWAI